MARKRMIDPEFFLDESLCEVSAFARLLYIGLWSICDDNYATLPHRSKWIKAQVFPYDTVNIDKLLTELEQIGVIIKFTVEEQEFWYIKNFFKYQKVDRPSKPKYPPYNENTRRVLDTTSTNTRTEVKLSKDNIKESKTNEIDSFIFSFNKLSGKNYLVTDDRRIKLAARLRKYSMEDLVKATESLLKSSFHTGKNDKATWYATPDFILRSDEQVDKWLNSSVPSKLPVKDVPDWVKGSNG